MRTIYYFALLLLLAACKKESGMDRDTGPISTKLVLLDANGTNLLTSTNPLLVSVAYQENGQTIVLGPECGAGYSVCPNITKFSTNSNQPYEFVYSSGDMTGASLKKGREWYITVGGKTDTLYYELRDISANTDYKVVSAIFNGRPVQTDAVLDMQFGYPVFVLRRRR